MAIYQGVGYGAGHPQGTTHARGELHSVDLDERETVCEAGIIADTPSGRLP